MDTTTKLDGFFPAPAQPAQPAHLPDPQTPVPANPHITGPCRPGELWTVKLQCEVGTRQPIDRFFLPGGSPGVEVCATVLARCEPAAPGISAPTAGAYGHEAVNAGYPIVMVIYGVARLLGIFGQ